MKLAPILLLVAMMAPRSGVYVKGHSQAAEKIRATIENSTCYSPREAKSSAATLEVDHILKDRRSWIVLVLMDTKKNILWEGKGEEFPWPLPSPVGRMLRNMAKSTCQGSQGLTIQSVAAQQNQHSLPPPPIPHGAALQHTSN
jgi:hypothetical protein